MKSFRTDFSLFKTSCLLGILMGGLSSFAVAGTQAVNKKNVCSITINSDDEINAFKQYLPSGQFNFIELTQFAENPLDKSSKWLTRACAQGIKCDILIISGHFGGSFFGSSSKRLSLEDLEAASCNSQCDGILNDPKEVFLFGCNTLAGKNKDSRTPREYNRILIEDGFSAEQAARIVAFRYSPIGESFHDRMSQAFSGVQRIYGFNSVAPVGPVVKPLLQKYLSSTAKSYSQSLESQNPAEVQAPNQKLLNIFSKTSMMQSKGHRGEQWTQKPACFLNDKKVANVDKLVWVDSVVRNPDSRLLLNTVIHIEDFISRLLSKSQLTEEEKSIFTRLGESQSGKAEVLGFLKHPMQGLQAVQVNLLSFARDLGWVEQSSFNEQLEKVINLKKALRSPIRSEYRDFVCSLKVSSVEINPADIPPARWREELFVSLLACLKIKSVQFQNRVAENLIHDTGVPLQLASLTALKEFNSKNPEIQKILLKTLVSSGSPQIRSAAAETIGHTGGSNPTLRAGLVKSLQTDRAIPVRVSAAEALAASESTGTEALKVLANSLFKDRDKQVRSAAARALGHTGTQDVELHKTLLTVLAGDDFTEVKRSVAEALSNIRPPAPEIRSLIEKEIRRSTDSEVREFLIQASK